MEIKFKKYEKPVKRCNLIMNKANSNTKRPSAMKEIDHYFLPKHETLFCFFPSAFSELLVTAPPLFRQSPLSLTEQLRCTFPFLLFSTSKETSLSNSEGSRVVEKLGISISSLIIATRRAFHKVDSTILAAISTSSFLTNSECGHTSCSDIFEERI